MRFLSRDLTDQYISLSYQDVLQQYVNTGSLVYVLDGYGNVVFGIPTASVGYTVITSDVTSSMTVLSASYSQVIFQFSSSFSASFSSSFASQSISSSYALNASLADSSSNSISSSYALTASFALNVGNSGTSLTTGSTYPITSSWAVTSSYALTASYVPGLHISEKIKSGTLNGILFGGSPLTASVSLPTPFSGDLYSITITGVDPRTWSTQDKTANSFVINSNSNLSFSGDVGWQAIYTDVSQTAPDFRSGLVSGSLFTGIPAIYTVALSDPLPLTNYSVVIGSEDPRTWTYSQPTTSSFVLNSNSNVVITGIVSWQIII
jgi:hypothetical protein